LKDGCWPTDNGKMLSVNWQRVILEASGLIGYRQAAKGSRGDGLKENGSKENA
jgi:hypothetical protein